MKTLVVILVIVGVLLAFGWYFNSRPSGQGGSEIMARSGIHWHPELKITIFGQEQEIPADIGLGAVEMPIHTHAADGVIHLEFSGLVKADDIRLGSFFKIWGKRFDKDCIFDRCSGSAGSLKMLVNGKENFEYDNYVMRDKDKIEIIFEKPLSAGIKEITVVSSEFGFNPSSLSVKSGEKVKINFQNKGGFPHNLTIEGLGTGTKTIGSGESATIEFTAPAPGTYALFCSVPGHREAGMQGSLIIE